MLVRKDRFANSIGEIYMLEVNAIVSRGERSVLRCGVADPILSKYDLDGGSMTKEASTPPQLMRLWALNRTY